MLKINDILGVELELVNKCNLKCPLCIRSNLPEKYNNNLSIDIKVLLDTLDKLPNLQFLHLVGSVAEPTLYPNLIELLEYIKSRNIRVLISTNASTNIDWERIGELITPQSEVRFCIDGSTQELYSRYRVGGNLKKILRNFKDFKKKSTCVTTLQFIEFSYNQDDFENILKLKDEFAFDQIYKIPCDISNNADFQPIKKYEIANRIRSIQSNNLTIECFVENKKFIYINCFGEVITCCNRYELYMNTNNLNIYQNTLDECLLKINEELKNKYNDEVCKRSCNKTMLLLEKKGKTII